MTLCGLFALALLSLSTAQDPVDLLAASGLDETTASTYRPAGAIVVASKGFGDLDSTAYKLLLPLESSTPLKVTDGATKKRIFQSLRIDDEFSFSMMVKFAQFGASQVQGASATATLFSIESGSTIYLRIDIVARYAPRVVNGVLELSRNEIDIVITWRGTDGQTQKTTYSNVDEDGDGVKIYQSNAWSYLHFAFIREKAATDLDTDKIRITFYHSCTAGKSRDADSTFIEAPPDDADIFLMKISKSPPNTKVFDFGTIQDVLFRPTGYQFAEISVDYCDFCVRDCSNYIEIVSNEQKRLEGVAQEQSLDLRNCLASRRPPPPCVDGCRIEDGTRIAVGAEKKESACRVCKCIDDGLLRCIEKCSTCSEGGRTYDDGDEMPSSNPQLRCTCQNGSPSCTRFNCDNLIDGSSYKSNGLSCTEQPSCEHPAGVGCDESATKSGCFCSKKKVIYTDIKTGKFRCVKRFNCPCRVAGKEIRGGDLYFKDGQYCMCIGGTLECFS